MRKIVLFTLLALLINCSPSQKINGYGEHDNVCQKYDAELIGFSNYSTLYSFELHKDLLSNNKRKEILLNSFNLN